VVLQASWVLLESRRCSKARDQRQYRPFRESSCLRGFRQQTVGQSVCREEIRCMFATGRQGVFLWRDGRSRGIIGAIIIHLAEKHVNLICILLVMRQRSVSVLEPHETRGIRTGSTSFLRHSCLGPWSGVSWCAVCSQYGTVADVQKRGVTYLGAST